MEQIMRRHTKMMAGSLLMVLMVVVAGIVVYGVVRNKLIAPTAPTSKPAAASCTVSFAVLPPVATPTPKPVATPKPPVKTAAPVRSAH
jgi:hypothetical protein